MPEYRQSEWPVVLEFLGEKDGILFPVGQMGSSQEQRQIKSA